MSKLSVNINKCAQFVKSKAQARCCSVLNGKLPNDIVEFSKKSCILNKASKSNISANATNVMLGTVIGNLFLKNQIDSLNRIIKHISFTPATSVEEAIAFGQKKLKIKKYSGFSEKDLDVINFVNEGLTRVHNVFGGKIKIPAKIKYETNNNSPDCIASVNRAWMQIYTRLNPPSLTLNPRYFGTLEEKLSEKIQCLIDSKLLVDKGGLLYFSENIIAPDVLEQINAYRIAPDAFCFLDKLELDCNISHLFSAYNAFKIDPCYFIEKGLRQRVGEAPDDINDELQKFMNKLKQEDIDAQYFFLRKNLAENDYCIKLKKRDPFETIYHEIAHINDQDRVPAKTVFGNPERYPKALRDWLNNSDFIKSASRVSTYAKAGPGEFIAEVFAGNMQGDDFFGDENVMSMYKAMNGPKLPQINQSRKFRNLLS